MSSIGSNNTNNNTNRKSLKRKSVPIRSFPRGAPLSWHGFTESFWKQNLDEAVYEPRPTVPRALSVSDRMWEVRAYIYSPRICVICCCLLLFVVVSVGDGALGLPAVLRNLWAQNNKLCCAPASAQDENNHDEDPDDDDNGKGAAREQQPLTELQSALRRRFVARC